MRSASPSGRQLAVDDGRAVVRRRLEGRVRHDEPVDDRDAEHRRRARGHLAQRPGPGRAVQQHAVAVAGEEHRHHPRAAVDDGREGAGEHLVEQGVERLALGAPALGVPAQPLDRGVPAHPAGVAGPGARGIRHDARSWMPGGGPARRPPGWGAASARRRSSGRCGRGARSSPRRRCTRTSRPPRRRRRRAGRRRSTRTLVASRARSPRHPLSCPRQGRHRSFRGRRPARGTSTPAPVQRTNWPSPRSSSHRFRRTSIVVRMPRTTRPVDLVLDVADGPAPLRHRLADAVVAELRAGRLRPGDALPSTRALAGALRPVPRPGRRGLRRAGRGGVRREPGGLGGRRRARRRPGGRGRRAHPRAHPARLRRRARSGAAAQPARWDLRPGRPDTSLVDPAAWRRAWRAAGSAVPGNDAGAGPSHDRLRRVLAEHLRRSRGVAVAARRPARRAGGRRLPARAAGRAGARRRHRRPRGPRLHRGVDGVRDRGRARGGGARRRRRPRPGAAPRGAVATYVTPSHQYPLGARMPVTRRVQLLEWARRTGALVLEDDYDGEFRYDVSPLPALRSLPGAEEHVVYIGTASKLVAPSLRVAWVAPPRRLRDRLRRRARVARAGGQRGHRPRPGGVRRVRSPGQPTTPG